jgi:carboxylate-amine ligase
MRDQYTVGVEEEYQLLDPETGALRSRASDVLRTDWSDDLKSELHESTVEIDTPVCTHWDQVREALGTRRFQAAATAAAEDLEIAAAGTHPFSRWDEHGIHPDPRYRELADRHDRVARRVNIFGMHVHVGVPDSVDRARLMERLKCFSPHLVALAASSPFVDGDDTGFASYRAILWRLYPFMGIPPRFESEDAYVRYVDYLVEAGAIRDRASIYWSLRPHLAYPTLEFRMADTCPRADDAATIALLVRVLAVGVAEDEVRLPGPGRLTADTWRAVLTENEWSAARYGLDATLADPEHPDGRIALRDGVRRVLELVQPVAEALGDGDVLDRVESLLERGNGADRMRRIHRHGDSLQEVASWLVRETRLGTGFDRREWQRASGG